MKRQNLLIAVFCFLPFVTGFAANINVPSLELITRGRMAGGSLQLASRGAFDLMVEGGYNFGGRLVLSFSHDNLLDFANPGTINFKSASIVLRDLFQIPMTMTYFIGEYGSLCSGTIFFEQFGTDAVYPHYSGYSFFPTDVRYFGLRSLTGIGMRIASTFGTETALGSLYVFQDGGIGSGVYSADLDFALNFENVKMEAFIGATFPTAQYGLYHAGLMFYVMAGPVEFLTQLGIPRFEPGTDVFSTDLFYLLFEPRLKLGLFSMIPSFFWHPRFYGQNLTNEAGYIDVSLDLLLGDLIEHSVQGGVQGILSYRADQTDPIRMTVSPHVSLRTPGIIWEFRVDTNFSVPPATPFVFSDFLQFYLGMRAEF